jgi:hypothetical protein
VGARNNALFVVGVVLVLGLVGIGYVTILDSEDPPAPVVAATPAPAAESAVRLSSAAGVVEINVGDAGWQPLEVGGEVAPGAGVRTSPEGAASLTYGDGIKADMGAGSVVRVDRMDDEVARFVVGKGQVVIDVSEQTKGDRVVQLAAEGSDAVVETRDGRVAVINDGSGQLQTAVTRGNAVLSANGGKVSLKEGQQSLVEKGRKPTAPTEIPKSLLLKVQWPTEITSKRRHRISGKATPGTLVRVGDQVVAADGKGRFTAVVDLKEGRNRIVVRAVDVIGRAEASESPEITVDTKAPAHSIETDPEMWRRK